MFDLNRLRQFGLVAVVAAIPAACAPTTAGPATAPPAAAMTTMPATQGGAATVSNPMPAMDHSKMDGMDHSKMKGMDHSKMEGMEHSKMGDRDHSRVSAKDHRAMQNHCNQMRQTVRRGETLSPQMQEMMTECNEMSRATPARRTP